MVLGPTGRNFAAGMSGGIAYLYDQDANFKKRCNPDMIEIQSLKEEDRDVVYNLVYNHFKYTASPKAKQIIGALSRELKKFIRVIPLEYKRILEGVKIEEKLDLMEASDG